MKETQTFDEKGYLVTSVVSDYEEYDIPPMTSTITNKDTDHKLIPSTAKKTAPAQPKAQQTLSSFFKK